MKRSIARQSAWKYHEQIRSLCNQERASDIAIECDIARLESRMTGSGGPACAELLDIP